MRFFFARHLFRLAFVGLLGAVGWAQAQTFPSRPVTLLVPWPAGGASDFAARLLSKELAPLLGQPVIVENVPGAGGSLGAAKALKAPADGYTLLLSSPLDLILAPLSFPSAGYKPEEARTLALLGRTDLLLVTRKDLGAETMGDLVAMLKANPGKPLSYCALSNGLVNHLVGERIQALAGVKMLGVPYSGVGPCVRDVIGGQVDIAFLPMAGAFPGLVDKGSLKALAVLGESVHPRFPRVLPASATPGFEDFSLSLWAGVHVSPRVPDDVVEQLHLAVHAALARPELRYLIESTGGTVFGRMSLAQAQAAYLKEVQLFQAMARLAGTDKP